MKSVSHVTKMNLLQNRGRTFTYILGIVLAVGFLSAALSLQLSMFAYLSKTASTISGETMGALGASGLQNLLKVFAFLFADEDEPPVAVSAEVLFSVRALIQNLPVLLQGVGFVSLLMGLFLIKITFSLGERERMHFYGLLLAAGATPRHVRQSALCETLYLSALGLPAGLAAGIGGTWLAKLVFRLAVARKLAPLGITEQPVFVSVHISALLFAAAFAFCFLTYYATKSAKKVKKYTVMQSLKNTDDSTLGIAAFTPSDIYFKLAGAPGHIASRNMQNNILKYMLITFMMTSYVAVFVISLFGFHLVRDYNQELFEGISAVQTQEEAAEAAENRAVVSMVYATETYFTLTAGLIAVVALAGTFHMIAANINTNVGEYAILHSVGMSRASIRKAVRIEGLLCAAVALVLCWFTVAFFIGFMYIGVSGIDVPPKAVPLIAIPASTGAFLLSVFTAVFYANKKIKNMDLIALIKDECY
ncbi:MAG: FtsX-like permease family protein [Oscillospiraceae bacterium]|jgi:ABC-type antimicrobial peptide transport system permease subunit|nr:FtsX-like permease family protein [Oscillospiraceae bacterium]